MPPETPLETPAKSTEFDYFQPEFTFWDALRRGNALSFEARSASGGKCVLQGEYSQFRGLEMSPETPFETPAKSTTSLPRLHFIVPKPRA